jgi:sugar phosphate isomerase/epimerase
MRLRAFRHLWGLEQEPLEAVMPRIAAKGYAGVEVVLQLEPDLDRLRAVTNDAGLAVKPLLQLLAPTPEEQLVEYRQLLHLAARFDPVGITVQGGRDRWPIDVAIEFYRQAVAVEADFPAIVGHETHRGRPLFAPWTTAAIVNAVPELRLVCDFSHWVVVCERLLEDQEDAIALAASRAVHMHTRVGYDQGPQVPDPRAPEWRAALTAHEHWWKVVWDAQRQAGIVDATFTPEFGPPPYMHTVPFSNAPVADLEAICDWQAEHVRELFERWTSEMGEGHE